MSEPCRCERAAAHERARAERPTDYLRGYRDGLNAILDAILRDPLAAPTTKAEAARVLAEPTS